MAAMYCSSTQMHRGRHSPSVSVRRRGPASRLQRGVCHRSWRHADRSPQNCYVSTAGASTLREAVHSRCCSGRPATSGAPLAAAWLGRCAASLLGATADRHTVVFDDDPHSSNPRGVHQGGLGSRASWHRPIPTTTSGSFKHSQPHWSAQRSVARPASSSTGATDHSYEAIRTSSGMHVAGKLDGVPEQVLLRGQRRRRGVKSARLVEQLAGRIAFLAAERAREGQERAA